MESVSLKGMIFVGQKNTRYISLQNVGLVALGYQGFLGIMGRLGTVQVA